MREQVEGLEHEADPLSQPIDVEAGTSDIGAPDQNATSVDRLETA